MTKTPFSELNLTPKVERAVTLMGFAFATPVQAEVIPLIRAGADVIARSQTGTGKTVAFAIPAIEMIDTHESKPTIQVLVLCPTRELAQQATEEIRKLARFNSGIRPVEIYGGAPIDKQCIRLRNANIVIGTPGRVMDHMRRKTIKLAKLKMIVLDEADVMLSMGFKEDIKTILADTSKDRQTVLFSATMPPSILALTKEFQKDPQLIEINKSQVTIDDIDQSYIDVPHRRKKDALGTLLQTLRTNRAIIFCNTKRMVDDLNNFLTTMQYNVDSIHSDITQSRRTAVMKAFKRGETSILIATDIAARGIDVTDIEYVINYDIPQNTEYYIHRIGRTGRAGKSGQTITICGDKREVNVLRNIGLEIKCDINLMDLPPLIEFQKTTGIQFKSAASGAAVRPTFTKFKNDQAPVLKKTRHEKTETVVIDVGAAQKASVNHIIGAMTEYTALLRSEIGKIDIFPTQTVVEVPVGHADEVLTALADRTICGKQVTAVRLAEAPIRRSQSSSFRQ